MLPRYRNWTAVEWVIVTMLVSVIAFIAFGIWLEVKHPCVEQGAEHTTLMQMSCGDGCIYFVPVTSRDCLRREP